MIRRWSSPSTHKGHALWDRARDLARAGKTDAEIAKELGIPVLNVEAMTHRVRKRQADTSKKYVGDT